MRAPEEIIGPEALAALEAEGYVVAEPCDLWPVPQFVTREQRHAEITEMIDRIGAITYPTQKEKRDE